MFTPNSTVLSEQAFKGLGGFGKGALDASESEYEDSEGELGVSEAGNVDELDVTKLGLPQRLVDSLEKRGITQLFPIQVCLLSILCPVDFSTCYVRCILLNRACFDGLCPLRLGISHL